MPTQARIRLVWTMVWGRAALAPVMLLGAALGWDGRWLSGIVAVALVDDIADGMMARRWGCDTPGVRLADSVADTIFYLGVAGALWLRVPRVVLGNRALLFVLAGLEVLRYGLDFWKFGKGASYHSYLAKAWGLVLGAAVMGALAVGGGEGFVRVSVVLGIAANCEGLTMSLMLPQWRNDVKTLGAAWRMRKAMIAGKEGCEKGDKLRF